MEVFDGENITNFPIAGFLNPAATGREKTSRSFKRGVSLIEMLIVVAVIGIMAAVGIPMMQSLFPAKAQIATRNLNYLNGAVASYNQAVSELNTNASESVIMGILQARDTNSKGSPYLPTNLSTNASSDSSTYRATWTGRMFEELPPGTNGAGLDLLNLM